MKAKGERQGTDGRTRALASLLRHERQVFPATLMKSFHLPPLITRQPSSSNREIAEISPLRTLWVGLDAFAMFPSILPHQTRHDVSVLVSAKGRSATVGQWIRVLDGRTHVEVSGDGEVKTVCEPRTYIVISIPQTRDSLDACQYAPCRWPNLSFSPHFSGNQILLYLESNVYGCFQPKTTPRHNSQTACFIVRLLIDSIHPHCR